MRGNLLCSLLLLPACVGALGLDAGDDLQIEQAVAPAPRSTLDPIDGLTGEALDADGQVPPRSDTRSAPSYANLPTEALWEAIRIAGNQAFVVVKSRGQARGFYQGRRLVGDPELAASKADMLRLRGLHELTGDGPQLQVPQTVAGMVFPGFFVRIDSMTVLTQLRARPDLDYVEPLYSEMVLPQSGCGYDDYYPSTQPWLLDEIKTSYHGVTDIVPYPFRHLGITRAWNRFPKPGAGVRVAVLDTGSGLAQDQLHDRFPFVGADLRMPAIHRDATGTGLEDTCGHGTKVAGILAAPNDGRSIVGGVFAAELTTVKVGSSPAQDTFSGPGPVCAGISSAIADGARVINMSFGFLISSPTVEACIRSAFDTKPVIFVAAAGTGPQGGVIFPANMNREVTAVTSVDIVGLGAAPAQGTYQMIPGGGLASVAYGQDVDFSSAYGSNRMPSTGGYSDDNGSYIAAGGGTSSAAPTLSAVFALAIQGLPSTATRSDIISAVVKSSTIQNVHNPDGSVIGSGYIGNGIPDAYVASGGTTRVDIVASPGNIVMAGQSFTLTAIPDGFGLLRYAWGAGGWHQTETFTAPATAGPYAITLHVTDDRDPGFAIDTSKTVTVVASPPPPPTVRTLASTAVVYMNQSFPVGDRGDFRVHQGVAMPAGCVVTARKAHVQCVVAGATVDCANTSDATTFASSNFGFTVSTPAAAGPSSLDTLVHLWHDANAWIYVRVKYTVTQPAGMTCDVPGATQ